MSIERRELHLNAFLRGAGPHEAAWRLPESNPRADFDLRHWIELAQLAENAKFDSLFLADGPALTGTGASPPPRARRAADPADRPVAAHQPDRVDRDRVIDVQRAVQPGAAAGVGR